MALAGMVRPGPLVHWTLPESVDAEEEFADMTDMEPVSKRKSSRHSVSTTASFLDDESLMCISEDDIEAKLGQEEEYVDMTDMEPVAKRKSSRHSVSTTASFLADESLMCIREDDIEDNLGQPVVCRRKSRQSSGGLLSLGAPPSDVRFAEPAQTMIILDWDDTLFPSTELFDRWGVSYYSDGPEPPEKQEAMEAWRDALFQYLSAATALSERCVIVTNSKKAWVESCIRRFAPCLAKFFRESPDEKTSLRVVYSIERLGQCRRMRSKQSNTRPVARHEMTSAEHEDKQTRAKYMAMRQEVKEFYSQYPGQSWKNVISEGDMSYEHDAVTELAFRRNAKRPEKLRIKAIIVPTAPTITELTLRLQVGRLLLPAYVRFDGDLDLDLRSTADPLMAIAEALRLPHLMDVPLSLHAWGREPMPEDSEEVEDALGDLAVAVHTALYG